MRSSLSLGRVFGIPIGVNWSLLAIAALLTWTLAGGLYPELYPSIHPVTAILISVLSVVLFFGSILAHELGHSVVAQRAGIKVEGITLWLLGGVARLSKEPQTARDELKIAAAGPAVSILAALTFSAIAAGTTLMPFDNYITGVALYLAIVNGALAIFNLLPAAPLDGGRVLSSLVWMRTGSRTKATSAATTGGKVIGSVFIAWAAYRFFVLGDGFGLWTGLIGLFIIQTATQEQRARQMSSKLAAVTVQQVMRPHPPVAEDWMTLGDLSEMLGGRFTHSAYPVRGFDGRIVGMLVLADLNFLDPLTWSHQRVLELARPIDRVDVVLASRSLDQVVVELRHGGEVLVVDETGRTVGTLGPAELQRATQVATFNQPVPPAPDDRVSPTG